MQVTLLGCGTSSGVPLIGCRCKVCRSKNPKNNRLRASAYLEIDGKGILIDTSTDLRAQALKFSVKRVDAVLFTHPHADHIHGIDELRSFNYLQKESIPVYGNEWTHSELTSKFGYIFKPIKVEGGGVPRLILNKIEQNKSVINVLGIPVTPLWVKHGSKDSLGFRIESIAYLTDCSYIPNETLEKLKGLDVLFLDCVRIKEHPTHLNLEQALKCIEQVKPKKTFLTHLGHEFEYGEYQKKRLLPKGVALGFDGLKIRISRKVSAP